MKMCILDLPQRRKNKTAHSETNTKCCVTEIISDGNWDYFTL